MLGDKDIHGESETVPVDEFVFPRQSGALYDTWPTLNALSGKSSEDVASQSGSDDDDDSYSKFCDTIEYEALNNFCQLNIWREINKWCDNKTGKEKMKRCQ